MAETSTAINACNARVYMDNAQGALVEVTGSANKAELNKSRETADYTVFGSDWKRRLQCKKDGSLDLTFIYTTAANEGIDLLQQWFDAGGLRTWVIDENGGATGNDRHTGEFFLTELGIPHDSSEAGPIMVTASLLPDGAIHKQTIGS